MKLCANFIVEYGHRFLVALSIRNKNGILYLRQLLVTALITQLMNSMDYFINMPLVQYILPCFDTRDKTTFIRLNIFLLLLLLICL